jgi:hypothetical protein
MAFTFLKTGAESAKLAQRAAAEAEQRKLEQGKMYRFWMKEKEEARITFVDGDLNSEGHLVPPRYYEHNLNLNGTWNNFFLCPEKTNPDSNDSCPICESGDRPSLVALFTVIDHRQIQSTKDKSKVWKDQKKLLVAKTQTYEMLNKHAMKRGGLAGCTFDASRVGDKSASVGSMFEFVEKHDIEELKKVYQIEKVDPKTNAKVKATNFTPANYDAEIVFRNGEDLRKHLKNVDGGGDEIPSNGSPAAPGGGPDYSKEL